MTSLMRMTLPLRTDARMYSLREAWIKIFNQVCDERLRQDVKWGKQRHPHSRGDISHRTGLANAYRSSCNVNHRAGVGTWHDILAEEMYEANAADDPYEKITELVQTIAVAVAQLEQIYEEVGDPCMSTVLGQAPTAILAERPA